MARLPEIETIGVQESSGAPLRVDAARRQSIETLQKGFAELGKELVDTEKVKAKAVFAQEMGAVEDGINATKTVSTGFLREQLGEGFNDLDPALRAQLVQKGLDINSGKETEFDIENIPMWKVAGVIFDAKSKEALAKASKHITTGGWQADFQDEMQGEIVQRKIEINKKQMAQLSGFLTEQQTQAALERAGAASAISNPALRAAEFAKIRKDVAGSRAMDAEFKAKLTDQISKLEEVAPVYEALRRDDYAEMAVQLGRLNDPKEFTGLSPQERAAMSDRLKAEIKQFKAAVDGEQKRVLRDAAERGWNALFTKLRSGAPLTLKDIPAPGSIPADDQRQMIEYVTNKVNGVEAKTDLPTYYGLTQMWREEPDKFAQLQLTRYLNVLSPSDFKHFADLQTKPDPVKFDDVVNTDEAINAALLDKFKIDVKKPSNDQEKSDISRIKSLVQGELAQLGHRATLEERNKIIDDVTERERKTEAHWYGDRQKPSGTRNVPPGYTVAIREIHAQLARINPNVGATLSPEMIESTYKDFTNYSPDIERAWKLSATRKRVFTPSEAMRVYGYLKANWGTIDAELTRRGNALNNENRTALAVQTYLTATSR
jgi:hypothetical protein